MKLSRLRKRPAVDVERTFQSHTRYAVDMKNVSFEVEMVYLWFGTVILPKKFVGLLLS